MLSAGGGVYGRCSVIALRVRAKVESEGYKRKGMI